MQLCILAVLGVSCRSGTSVSGPGTADEAQQLRRKLADLAWQEKTITAEYALARNPAPYLVIDLPGRSISLRALARPLRSFRCRDIRRSAPGKSEFDTWTLAEKKPLQISERPKITPGAGEQGAAAAEQGLWGSHRMPADYDLLFGGGKVLEVRALPSEQSGWRIVRAIISAYRRTADWYRHWSISTDAESQYTLQIWLTENDSRALFWSLPKQLNVLIIDSGD